jgi:hypothetical protein
LPQWYEDPAESLRADLAVHDFTATGLLELQALSTTFIALWMILIGDGRLRNLDDR